MTVKELRKRLKQFDPDLPVILSDGFRCNFYSPEKAEFKVFDDLDGTRSLDIGIGGCDLEVSK